MPSAVPHAPLRRNWPRFGASRNRRGTRRASRTYDTTPIAGNRIAWSCVECLVQQLVLSTAIAVCLARPIVAAQAPDPLRRLADWGATLRPPAAGRAGAEVVRPGPGAAIAGLDLRAGDRIVRVNGRAIERPADVDDYLLRFRAGDAVVVDTERHGGATSTWRGRLSP